MKLLVKTSTVNRKILEAQLNIIERLEKLSVEPAIMDEIVDVVSSELENVVERR